MKNISIVIAAILISTMFTGCVFEISGTTFSIKNFHYCSSIDGWRSYEKHSNQYTIGEQVFMYFEVEGFKTNDDGIAQIYQTLTVIAPNGSYLVLSGAKLQDYPMIDQAFDASGKDTLWFDNHLTPINQTWDKGKYKVTINVEDRLAEKSVSYTSEFYVV